MTHATYLDSLYLKFQGGVFVDNNHRMRVHLQTGQSPHVIDTPLDASLEGWSLVCTSDDDDNLAGLYLLVRG